MNEQCNEQTGENIIWSEDAQGQHWNYPPDFWYGRENAKTAYRVTVLDGENFGAGFLTGDVLEIDAIFGDLRPGDLILDVDKNGGVIRSLRSLDALKGPDRGKVLAAVDFPPIFMLPENDGWSVEGRVITLIRDLETASRKA